MPTWFLPYGIGIATVATITASQALITGTFIMVNEAMKLRLWPMILAEHPTHLQGQIYKLASSGRVHSSGINLSRILPYGSGLWAGFYSR